MENRSGVQPPSAAQMVISGLTIIKSGGATYMGKIKHKGPPLVLTDALEVHGIPTQGEEGRIMMRVDAMTVMPLNRSCEIEFPRPDAIIDISRDSELAAFYSSFTGITGLHLPDGVIG